MWFDNSGTVDGDMNSSVVRYAGGHGIGDVIFDADVTVNERGYSPRLP